MKNPVTGRFGGFTLTELLVVVIVIGVLAAIVLPKFSKVLETRKTTEAEEMMAAVRTEQERRCALDKNYTKNKEAVNLVSLNTKNFTYSLGDTGMEAVSTGKYAYTLKMPSYRDGRLCCENADACGHLNKDYPQCAPLTARADYESGVECTATDETAPTEKNCSGSAGTRSCGCLDKGTQSQTCNTSTGTWEWGSCSIDDCSPVDIPEQPVEKKCSISDKPFTSCGNCGTRDVTCENGEWKSGTCNQPLDAVCTPGNIDYQGGGVCPTYMGFMQPKEADATPTKPGSGSTDDSTDDSTDLWMSGRRCDESCHWENLECAKINDSASSSGGSGSSSICGESDSVTKVHLAGGTVCRRVCSKCGTDGCQIFLESVDKRLCFYY